MGNDTDRGPCTSNALGSVCQGDLHGICQEQSEAGLLQLLLLAEGREKELDHILVPFRVGCFLLKSL